MKTIQNKQSLCNVRVIKSIYENVVIHTSFEKKNILREADADMPHLFAITR